MNIIGRVRRLEVIKKKNSKGWYTFKLKVGETLEEGCKRVGIPEDANNVIGLRGGFPLESGKPSYLFRN